VAAEAEAVIEYKETTAARSISQYSSAAGLRAINHSNAGVLLLVRQYCHQQTARQ